MNIPEQLSEVIGRTGAEWIGKVAAAERVLEAFVVIPKDKLPQVTISTAGNGFVTALAQSNYQPQLRFSSENGDTLGEWNRRIAYHNLAVALAVEQQQTTARHRLEKRRDELAAELAGEGFSRTTYNSVSVVAKNAIDRLIDIEDGNQ